MIPDSLYMAFVMKHCVADTSWSRLSDTFTVSTAAPLTQELPSLPLLSRGSNRALFSLQSPEWSNRGLNIPPKTISSWAMASILQAQIPKGLSSENYFLPIAIVLMFSYTSKHACNVNLYVCAGAEHVHAHALMQVEDFLNISLNAKFQQSRTFCSKYFISFFTCRCKNQRSLIF